MILAFSRWLLILFFSSTASLLFAQITEKQFQEVDQVFAKWNRTDRPGAALAMVHNGTIIYEKGYGMADLEHGIDENRRGARYAPDTTICYEIYYRSGHKH